MRELTSHKVNGLNNKLLIKRLDEPGPCGAFNKYIIQLDDDPIESYGYCIDFQNGPIAESGYNGITNEALLAIVEDRLKCFQAGPYACRENAIALTHVQDAMHWLHHRTRERLARGVEGTSAK